MRTVVLSARAVSLVRGETSMKAEVELIEPKIPTGSEFRALVRQMVALFNEYVKLERNVPSETLIAFESPRRLPESLQALAQLALHGFVQTLIAIFRALHEQFHLFVQIHNDLFQNQKLTAN